jgi:hypothetical protein
VADRFEPVHDLRPLPGALPGGIVGAQQRRALPEESVERFRSGAPRDGVLAKANAPSAPQWRT